jgi:hypothetical protein
MNPEINLFNFQLIELNMLISNWFITFPCFYFFWKIKKKKNYEIQYKNYALFFLFTSISSFLGGIGHAFSLHNGEFIKVAGWMFTLLANFVLIAKSVVYLPINVRKPFTFINFLKTTLAVILTLSSFKFFFITVDIAITMLLFVLPGHIMAYYHFKFKFKLYIIYGILFSTLTGLVGALKISVSENWLNTKDISHYILLIGLCIIYFGISREPQISPSVRVIK